MLESIPGYVQIGFVIFGAVGSGFGIYRFGIQTGSKKNGYVTKSDCQVNVQAITKSIDLLQTKTEDSDEKLHSKINEVGKGVAKIQGYIEGQNN